MNKTILSLLIIFVWGLGAPEVSGQSAELCQGHYYTEAEGAAKLASLRERMRTAADWEQRADSIRAHVREGMELDNLPARSPLNPRFRNKKEFDGYTVESVVFESLPGFYVTGNLYRPTGKFKKKSLAVVLMPHGHFPPSHHVIGEDQCAHLRQGGTAILNIFHESSVVVFFREMSVRHQHNGQ